MQNGFVIKAVIEDIGSSFNFRRPGLTKLLDLVLNNEIKYVIIYDIDRLSRIAFDLFQQLFKSYGVEIIVVDQSDSSIEARDEILKELVSFVHYIASKLYGKRSYKKKLKKVLCQEKSNS